MKTTIQLLVTLLLGALASIFGLIVGNYDNSRCNVTIIAAGIYASGYVAVACILGLAYISVKNDKQ
jgi:vacuolar-type H+-ATPase subunit I/STV1